MANFLTYNPASILFRQRDDLVALSAADSYTDYYDALAKREINPCRAMIPTIKKTVNRYMKIKDYPESTISAYQTSIAEEIVNKCDKHILKVQELASKVDESMKARWRKYKGGKTKKRKNVKHNVTRKN